MMKTIYRGYRKSAEKRGLAFALSQDEFVLLATQPCAYCGMAPSQMSFHRRSNGAFVYNGLDRVDNARGYTLDNVAPCCGACNDMKGTKTVEEFLLQCRRIVEHWEVHLNGRNDGTDDRGNGGTDGRPDWAPTGETDLRDSNRLVPVAAAG